MIFYRSARCKARRTVESSSRGAKIVRNVAEGADFSKPTGIGDKWTILVYVGGENRAADSNFSEKMASRYRTFETALSTGLTSSIASC